MTAVPPAQGAGSLSSPVAGRCPRPLPNVPRGPSRTTAAAKLNSSCRVTQQSLEDENTYPYCPATWRELTTFTAEILH